MEDPRLGDAVTLEMKIGDPEVMRLAVQQEIAHSDAQCPGQLWRGQPENRQVRVLPMCKVRRNHVPGFPEQAAPASRAAQAHGCGAGQREIPSRCVVADHGAAVPQSSDLAVPAAIQPRSGPRRGNVEAGATPMYAILDE